MKQRTTIYNPRDDSEIIKHLDDSNLIVESESLTVEHKYTWSNLSFKYISQFRIESKFNHDHTPVFQYNSVSGISIYIKPKQLQSNEIELFYHESSQLISSLLPIHDLQYINTINSIYYYSPVAYNLKFNYKLFGDIQIEPGNNLDLLYNGNTLVLRQLIPDVTRVHVSKSGDYKEIGVFHLDHSVSSTKDDLVLNGFRVVFDPLSNDDNIVHNTMFHIKPRHRYIKENVTSRIEPNGLHPIIETKLNQYEIQDPDIIPQSCKLYYYLNLNKSLIFDPFQSIPQGATLILNNGEKNLESPEYKVDSWGNEILFEYDQFQPEIKLMVHSRYQMVKNESLSEIIQSCPFLFLGCSVVEDEKLLEKSPFDAKAMIGGNYQLYFTNDTVFYHFEAVGDNLSVSIPNGVTSFERVNFITTIAIIIGLVIVLIPMLNKPGKRKLE